MRLSKIFGIWSVIMMISASVLFLLGLDEVNKILALVYLIGLFIIVPIALTINLPEQRGKENEIN